MEQRIEQLEASKDYLRHLMCCEDDDIAECRFLEREVSAHTPRGRVSDSDLVAAARAAGDTLVRDETPADRSPREENPARCNGCRGPVPQSSRGRPRKYCSRACQQRAYRARRGDRA